MFVFRSASVDHLYVDILGGRIQIVSQIVLLRSLKPCCCLLVGALVACMKDDAICINLLCSTLIVDTGLVITAIGNTFPRTSLRNWRLAILGLIGTHSAQLGQGINASSLFLELTPAACVHFVLASTSNLALSGLHLHLIRS